MNILIKLDHSGTTFTNGETIYGKILVHCPSAINLSKINVTLVGDTVSNLPGGFGLLICRNNKETHCIAYDKQEIIPYSQNLEDRKHEPFNLKAGYHSFSFGLQIPWFTGCSSCRAKTPITYSDTIKRPCLCLPPSMNGLMKGAEISYRIDASITIIRNMFKSTLRKSQGISVWPIDTRSLSMASPDYFTDLSVVQASIKDSGNSIPVETGQGHDANLILLSSLAEPARFSITASFPEDYALTCCNDVTMRLSVKKMNLFPTDLYLQSFQILLVGYTDVRAGNVAHGEMTFWMIQSLSNINMKICAGEDGLGETREIDQVLWEGKPLPNAVVPSFTSCNIQRRYELEILMGFQCGSPKSRVLFVQLRTPVQIFSGLRPGRRLSIADMESFNADSAYSPSTDCFENGIVYNRVHGLLHDRGSPHSYGDNPPPSTPPTYEEAIEEKFRNSLN